MIDHPLLVKEQTRPLGSLVSLTRILLLVLIALLTGCEVSGPVPTPTPPTTPTEPVTPPATPDEPATPPGILPEDFPEPFPTTPSPPVTQPDVPIPYLGDWIWVAQAQDGSVRTGYLSVTQTGKIFGPSLVGGEGGYLQCDTSDCEGALEPPILRGGVVLGTYTGSDGSGRLTAAFGSFDGGYLELAAFDDDGRMGTEVQDRESFVGTGAYYSGPERQGETPVVVTIGRLTDSPMIPFGRDVTATVKALAERANERAAMMAWDATEHGSPRESRDRP